MNFGRIVSPVNGSEWAESEFPFDATLFCLFLCCYFPFSYLFTVVRYLVVSKDVYKALSTLSQKSATVAVVSPFSATVSLFCDSVDRA